MYLYFPRDRLSSIVPFIIIIVINILRFTRTKANASHIPHWRRFRRSRHLLEKNSPTRPKKVEQLKVFAPECVTDSD